VRRLRLFLRLGRGVAGFRSRSIVVSLITYSSMRLPSAPLRVRYSCYQVWRAAPTALQFFRSPMASQVRPRPPGGAICCA
jgi:hypothetical protein